MLKKWLVLLISFALFPFYAASAQNKPKTDSVNYIIHPLRIQHDFEINGKLTRPIWQRAQAVYITHEYRPLDQNPAPVKTKVKVLYSDHYLYVGFWAQDPDPSEISAHISERDQISNDDQVGILLDPFNSNQHAYKLFVNPYGIQLDAKQSSDSRGFRRNNSFDMIWYSKGAINDSGYTAVMKIPFNSIHFPHKRIQNWSINFIRKYPRNSSYRFSWTDVSLGNPCMLCQNGHLVGLKGIQSSNPVDIIPYALGYKSGRLNNPNDPASGLNSQPVGGRIGGTVIYSPTSTSTIDATINPDFSQVETDATKISVNKTFALRYSEKRPFFLKKANIFKTGYNLFYSRTINRPWAAAKYTQTAHKFSIGFLTAYDRNTPFVIPGLLESSAIETKINAFDNILRGKYNIGSQSYIGGLVTTRNVSGGHNYVGSVDWNFFLGHHFYFSGAAAYSTTKEMNNTTLFNNLRKFGQSRYDAAFNGQQYGGSFLNFKFERQARYYDFSLGYKSLSPTFQAHNGFITHTDRRLFKASQEISYYPNKKWLSKGSLSIKGTWRYDFANTFKERSITVTWSNFLIARTSFRISYTPLNDETFRGHFFTKIHHINFNINSQPAKFISFNIRWKVGRSIYRTLHPKLGHGYNLSLSTTLKPTKRLKLSMSYNYSTLSALDGSKSFFSGSISRLEGHYSFSRHLFFRLIAQYDSFSEQIQVYPLLYYKLNPFTKFYIGMTDNLQHVDRFGPPRINEYRQINREFFVKIQYLIQM